MRETETQDTNESIQQREMAASTLTNLRDRGDFHKEGYPNGNSTSPVLPQTNTFNNNNNNLLETLKKSPASLLNRDRNNGLTNIMSFNIFSNASSPPKNNEDFIDSTTSSTTTTTTGTTTTSLSLRNGNSSSSSSSSSSSNNNYNNNSNCNGNSNSNNTGQKRARRTSSSSSLTSLLTSAANTEVNSEGSRSSSLTSNSSNSNSSTISIQDQSLYGAILGGNFDNLNFTQQLQVFFLWIDGLNHNQRKSVLDGLRKRVAFHQFIMDSEKKDQETLSDSSSYPYRHNSDNEKKRASDSEASTNEDKTRKNEPGKASKRRSLKSVTKNMVCIQCGTSSSPEWRKGPDGIKSLCNACGLRFSKKARKMNHEANGRSINEDSYKEDSK